MFSSAGDVARGGFSGNRVQDPELSPKQQGWGTQPRRGWWEGAFWEYSLSVEFTQSYSSSPRISCGISANYTSFCNSIFSSVKWTIESY